MSFWSISPGPHWSNYFKSFFYCKDTKGILSTNLLTIPKVQIAPSGTTVRELTEHDSTAMEALLLRDYQTFPRSRIFLSAKRISEGFRFDSWIGVGVFVGKELIGCAVSRNLGSLQFRTTVSKTGLVDFFCVAKLWRKRGLASLLLQELVIATAKKKRLVHLFQKEGLPLSPLPPIWQSQYIWRKKEKTNLGMHLSKEAFSRHSQINTFDFVSSLQNAFVFVPEQLTGDSEFYSFNYKGNIVFLCITDTFHRSVPDGGRIGEILWCVPKDTVPQEIQEIAVETLADSCQYDIVLMDIAIPHKKKWEKDSPYGYYIFNYNPGEFFTLHPSFVP